MRISDWSSDVCSSDLFARSTPDHRNIIHRVLLSTPTSKIAGRMERRPRHQLRTPARYETLAQRGCEYDDRDRYLPTWTRRDIRLQLLRGNPPRSEEHTSELQSLMRISYAVFCLKKKTNT